MIYTVLPPLIKIDNLQRKLRVLSYELGESTPSSLGTSLAPRIHNAFATTTNNFIGQTVTRYTVRRTRLPVLARAAVNRSVLITELSSTLVSTIVVLLRGIYKSRAHLREPLLSPL